MLARVVQRSVVRRSVCAASAAVAGALSAPFRTVVPAALVASPLLSRSFSAAAAASTGGLHVLDESKTELSSLTKGKAIVYYTAGSALSPCAAQRCQFATLTHFQLTRLLIPQFHLFAAWCGPCKMIAPHFSALAKQYADKGINFVKVRCLPGHTSSLQRRVARTFSASFRRLFPRVMLCRLSRAD